MQCVVVYDISDDNKRIRIADACLDYGLDRIQFSAFLGDLAPTHQDELMLRVQSILGKKPGNVQLFPICEKDWNARRIFENKAPDDVETSRPAGDRGISDRSVSTEETDNACAE